MPATSLRQKDFTHEKRPLRLALIMAAWLGWGGAAHAQGVLFDVIHRETIDGFSGSAQFSIPEGRLPDSPAGDPSYNLSVSYNFGAPEITNVSFGTSGQPVVFAPGSPLGEFNPNGPAFFTGSDRNPVFTPGNYILEDLAQGPGTLALVSIRAARPVYNFRFEGPQLIEFQLSGTPIAGAGSNAINGKALFDPLAGRLDGIDTVFTAQTILPSASSGFIPIGSNSFAINGVSFSVISGPSGEQFLGGLGLAPVFFPGTYNVSSSANGSLFRLTIFELAAPGIPEPTSWAMMIVGFGAIGAELRRRRGDAYFAQPKN
jgi:hypothetical protein